MTVLGRRTDIQTPANTVFGMVIVACSTSLVCACGAIAQYNGGSILQLMLGSYALQNLMGWSWWCIRQPSRTINWFGDSPYKCNIWTRGLLYWIMMFTWWKGLEMVPIGDAEAILFVSPMLTIFLARLLLKEKLPRVFPLTLLITAAGLIFVCQPSFIFDSTNSSYQSVSWVGMIFLVICISCWSATSLLVRTAKDAHWLQVNLVTSFQSAWMWTPIFAILNHFIGNNLGNGNGTPASNSNYSNVAWIDGVDFSDWDWSPETLMAILAMAFFEFFGVTCKVVGYQLGEATKVAAMEYLNIVFAFFFQWFLFHRRPNGWEWLGGSLLILSCVLHLIEEKYWPRNGNNKIHRNGYNNLTPHPAEMESFLPEGEDNETTLLKKYNRYSNHKNNRKYGTEEDVINMDTARILLAESSHSHINFNGSYGVEAYKDITRNWPRVEDRNTIY